ncbi:uncharacterized protein [Haliotis asinina]|uniref:uncharacterized protein n=1 Tax=Haliotis asinina TaxID=109174 RepID=UPI003531C149
MDSTTVTVITLVTIVGLRAAIGVDLDLQAVRLSPDLIQINCSLHEGFQPGDTIRILQPPNKGTIITCLFPSCRSNYNVTYGLRRATLSLTFKPKHSGLYWCIYNEEYGTTASTWITVMEAADTTTPVLSPCTADGQETPPTTQHDTTTPVLSPCTVDGQETPPTTHHDTTTPVLSPCTVDGQEPPPTTHHVSEPPASGFTQSAPGICVTYLGLIVSQCALLQMSRMNTHAPRMFI